MADKIQYRGPDDFGYWVDADVGIGLGHRRLSILDLSAAGHQPMLSIDGRYVLIYNGEVYNFAELRDRLEAEGQAPIWHGHSDTEIILAAICTWGLKKTLECLNGMFAFALWDRTNRNLTLARDRAGEKPLYYGWQGHTLLFGSEIKALSAHPSWAAAIDRRALASYTRFGYVPAPASIYQDIHKLTPGTFLTVPAVTMSGTEYPHQPYWSAVETARAGLMRPLSLDDQTATDELEEVLRKAVGLRMIADVPLGAFLSGGIDSSTIVALMQTQSSRPVKTFTIGFHEAGFNEAVVARDVAHHLGTDHTELYVSAKEAMDVVPLLPDLYDEPFADSSQIPTYLVSCMARRDVTVTLTGDTGDELFGGYNRYFRLDAIWGKIANVPSPVLRLAANTLRTIPPSMWDSFSRALPSRLRQPALGDKLHKLADVLPFKEPDRIYQSLASMWKNTNDIVPDTAEVSPSLVERMRSFGMKHHIDRMMLADFITYLPDDILVKVDRASMGVSLESRIPFLDPDVISLAWRLPRSQKIRNGEGKWLLRQVLYRHVPRQVVEHPKMGFAIPIASWLRGPLRDWAEALLDEHRLSAEGWFNPKEVRKMWDTHISGHNNLQHYLWVILMFQAWLNRQHEPAVATTRIAV